MFLIGLLIVLLATFAISKHEEYRIKDDRTSNEDELDKLLKRRWHFYKGLYQGIIATLIGIAFGLDLSLFFCAVFTVYHDAHLNKTVLNKPVDYVGETAWFDRTLKNFFRTDRTVFIFKLLVLAGAAVYLFITRV